MKRFAELLDVLDGTTRSSVKRGAIAEYVRSAPPEDAAWGVYLLLGRRVEGAFSTRAFREVARAVSGLPDWMIDACFAAVGDGAEAVALLRARNTVARGEPEPRSLAEFMEEHVAPLSGLAEAVAIAEWTRVLAPLAPAELYVALKAITGELRVGVSRTLTLSALADAAGVDRALVDRRSMGAWRPSADALEALLAPADVATGADRPYPFALAHPFDGDPAALEPVARWIAEWKWDGIRCQLRRRGAAVTLTSRGEEDITARFPEIARAAATLPDGVVLDGEIVAWADGERPLAFGALQRRIGRTSLTRSVLAEVPCRLVAFDLLEDDGADIRGVPLFERRARLEDLVAGLAPTIASSVLVEARDAAELAALRARARERGVEGLMLKERASSYPGGRVRGAWWKWKIEPLTVDVVLVYALAGSGRRASLFTDYGLAVWKDGELVPIARAYSGLADRELVEMDGWIRAHTTRTTGPLRWVEPTHVFELGFEAIARSGRHEGGYALRFPRILRWRTDKRAADADSIDLLAELERAHGYRRPEPRARQLGLFE